MKTDENISYWMGTTTPPEFPAFKGEKSCDVAVIGAGITGITVALMLAKKGLHTVVLEAKKVGSGATSKTTAKITIQHGLKYQQYIRGIGTENTSMYLKANMMGFETIESLIKENNIDCDFYKTDACVYADNERYLKKLENEKSAYDKLVMKHYTTDHCKLPFPVSGALCIPDQAYFHPLKYLYGLTDLLVKNKGEVYENSHVTVIDKEEPSAVHVNNGTLHAKYIILATNYPFIDMPGYYFIRVYQMRSYLTETNADNYNLCGMYINAGEPVNTMRTHKTTEGTKLLLGGYNHKTGHNKNKKPIYDKIDLLKQEKFPFIKDNIEYYWSTQDSVTLDHIPYIGPLSSQTPNIYIATGYDKWGMTNSATAALLISNSILGEHHPIMDTKGLFSPSRFTPGAAAKEFIMLGADAVKEYTVKSLAIPQGDLDRIRKGEAKIIRVNGYIAAVYRNHDGEIVAFDARCTHRLCPLTYNQTEHSWDCPCHGSRFDMEGNVLSGPAVTPLKKIEIEALKKE